MDPLSGIEMDLLRASCGKERFLPSSILCTCAGLLLSPFALSLPDAK